MIFLFSQPQVVILVFTLFLLIPKEPKHPLMSNKRISYFIPIPEDIRDYVLLKMRIKNTQRIYVISVVGLVFAFLLLVLDYIRFDADKLTPGTLYFYLFLNHLGLFLFIIPILIIRKNKEQFTLGEFKHGRRFIHVWILFLGIMLIIMSILTVIARESLTIYYIYVIIASFGLLMVHIDRILLISVSFIIIITTIIALYFGNLETLVNRIIEVVGVSITSFVVSSQIFNAFIREVVSEKLLEERNAEVAMQKARGDELMNNILPEEIATELKATGRVKPRHFSSVTIMFIDFQNFSQTSKSMTSDKLINMLDYCFRHFDRITTKHKLEKIKTIGDAYLCVGGVPESNDSHPFDSIAAAQDIFAFLNDWKNKQMSLREPFFDARIGIHSGPLVAGVVGEKKFAFDIWGDAVNIAARVESSGEVDKINISQTTYDLVKSKFDCQHRGKIPIKNQDPLDMYFVVS